MDELEGLPSTAPPAELLRQDRYTPEELAALLPVEVDLIRQAAFQGRLPAEIVGRDIVAIRREDVLRWLAERD